jgi:hypothetical protein
MAYERVIPIVDITARLVTSALSHGPLGGAGHGSGMRGRDRGRDSG